jgi:hypothetical protein
MDDRDAEFQRRRACRPVEGFTEKEAEQLEIPIPLDLWPQQWWWTEHGLPRFGEEMLDDF